MALQFLVIGILLPACVSGIVYLALWRPWRAGRVAPGWAAALALAIGYAAGQGALKGWPSLPPRVSYGWLPYLGFLAAAVAGILEWTEAARRNRSGVGGTHARGFPALGLLAVGPLAMGLLVFATSWTLTSPLRRNQWSAGESVAWVGGFGVVFLAVWIAVAWVGRNRSGVSDAPAPPTRWMPWAVVLSCAGGAAVLGLSGSVLMAQLAGMVAAGLGAQAVLLTLFPTNRVTPPPANDGGAQALPPLSTGWGWPSGVLPVTLTLVLGLWLEGLLFASLHWGAALSLTGSLLSAWIIPLAGRREGGAKPGDEVERVGWQKASARPILAFVVTSAFLCGAVIVAYYTSPPLFE